jgi:hypothetical protein
MDNVEDAVRETRLFQQVCQQNGRARNTFRWLQDEAIAARQRDRKHPHRYHSREIERGDSSYNTQRLPETVAIDARANVLRYLAF